MLLFFVSTTFFQLGQKNVQNFVDFLEDGRTWYFAFKMYWPLTANLQMKISQKVRENVVGAFSFKKPSDCYDLMGFKLIINIFKIFLPVFLSEACSLLRKEKEVSKQTSN